MIKRVEEHFDIKPDRLIGDTAYGTAPMLAWMVDEKDIEPHVPVLDKTERKNESLSISDFQWNEEVHEYRCPTGHALRSEWRAFKNQRSPQTNPEAGSIKATRNDRCKRRIYLGRCGTEFKKTGKTDPTRATGHGIGTPGISKNPQINPLTKLQRSTQNPKTTQRGEQVLK
jgi:hypothetical protein